MKVLIVGGGGREHAIAQSVAKSEKVDKIYCTPGNAGIAALAECAPIGAMEFDKIVAFAKEKEVDLVIVGMDDPLVGGLVDEGTDTGPIILQKAVEVEEGDTPEVLQRRVMEQAEWKILPKAIDLIANGKVKVEDGRTHII